MDILLKVFLPLSLAFIMFSLGLGLTVGDFSRVFKMPKALTCCGLMFALGSAATAPKKANNVVLKDRLFAANVLSPKTCVGFNKAAYTRWGVTASATCFLYCMSFSFSLLSCLLSCTPR